MLLKTIVLDISDFESVLGYLEIMGNISVYYVSLQHIMICMIILNLWIETTCISTYINHKWILELTLPNEFFKCECFKGWKWPTASHITVDPHGFGTLGPFGIRLRYSGLPHTTPIRSNIDTTCNTIIGSTKINKKNNNYAADLSITHMAFWLDM